MIAVTISAPDAGMDAAWHALAARAQANVFMHPAALRAAAEQGFARIHVLQAFVEEGGGRRLVGFWALRERRLLPLAPPILETLPYDYAFTSDPLIDPAFTDAVIAGFVSALGTTPGLPHTVSVQSLDSQSAAYAALRRQQDLSGAPYKEFIQAERPFAGPDSGVKSSGSTRKKLRQDWNRLSALGTAEIVNPREPAEVAAAFEAFLALEAGSWKGEQGTALLSDPRDARFVRRLIADLAAEGAASVALLRLNGQPIAAQVVLYAGGRAYTWKTAYDAAQARFSPGALLIDRLTQQLFESGIQAIDSCSAEGSFMAQLWTGRRVMIDALLDVRPQPSASFAFEHLRRRAYEALREARNRWRAWMAARPAVPRPS
jgi:CelD/BcsL family acetyltransferase involved in cellulose biosynthesis